MPVKSDTHFAFVDVLYVSPTHSLAASQSTNEGPCPGLVSITILLKDRAPLFDFPLEEGNRDLISPKFSPCVGHVK